MTEKSRFDPEPDKPYGNCSDCGVVLATREDMRAHFRETTPEGGGSSHSVRITNMTRAERIEHEVETELQSAMYDFTEELGRLGDAGDATEDEVTEAVKTAYIDVADEWKRYLSV